MLNVHNHWPAVQEDHPLHLLLTGLHQSYCSCTHTHHTLLHNGVYTFRPWKFSYWYHSALQGQRHSIRITAKFHWNPHPKYRFISHHMLNFHGLPTSDTWLPWQHIFPQSYQYDKSAVIFFKVLDVNFSKMPTKLASMNSAELAENGVQLCHQNTSFFQFQWRICYDLYFEEPRSYQHSIAHSQNHTGL